MKLKNVDPLLITSLIGCVFIVLFIRRPSGVLQLLSLASFAFVLVVLFCFLYFFISSLILRDKFLRSGINLVILIAGVLLVPLAGSCLRNQAFESHREAMEDFAMNISQTESGVVVFRRDELPSELTPYILDAQGWGNSQGSTDFVFFFGSGFPAKHSCWFFSPVGNQPDPT